MYAQFIASPPRHFLALTLVILLHGCSYLTEKQPDVIVDNGSPVATYPATESYYPDSRIA